MSDSKQPKHTPGPWRIEHFNVGGQLACININGPTNSGRGFKPVCKILTGFVNQGEDANLIAAAPELLEAAEIGLDIIGKYLEIVEYEYGVAGDFANKINKKKNKIEAAIKKAKEGI